MKMKKMIIIFIICVVASTGCILERNNPNDPLAIDDMVPPAMESVSPSDGAVDISPDSPVIITFSEVMDRVSVESAFSLTGASALGGECNWSEYDTVLTFTPDDYLVLSRRHIVSMLTEAIDAYGNPINTAWSKEFQIRGPVGKLDTSFNGQGWATHAGAAGIDNEDEAYSLAVDSAGKILLTGFSQNAAGNSDMVIWRYNSDGSLDTTFNGQGWVIHNSAAGGDSDDKGYHLAIDSSGKILVTGLSQNASGNSDMVIWRYNSDGSLDATFNGQGWVIHNSAAGGDSDDQGRSQAIDSAGKILVTGLSQNAAGNSDMVIWRYNSGGSLDNTFNGQGWVIHNSAAGGNSGDQGRSLVVDSAGKILVTGYSDRDTSYYDMVIWRYNSGGSLDTSFNSQGWVTHHSAAGGDTDDRGRDIVIDSAGKILVTGKSDNAAGDSDMVIWRYDSGGSLDTSFNGQGWVTHNSAAGGNDSDTGSCLVVSEDEKILVAGFSGNVAGDPDMAIWRYSSNGNIDTSFNEQGWLIHSDATAVDSWDFSFGIVIDPLGRILIAGSSELVVGSYDMVLWRYE
jgi:uncharacterized delta-60 repeat protein